MNAQVAGEASLKRQSLECLVAVLRSLVAWGTGPGKGLADVANGPSGTSIARRQSEDVRFDGGDVPLDKLNEAARMSTPDVLDDPSKFESEKQKKTMLLEGIKRFNFKPKKVKWLYHCARAP